MSSIALDLLLLLACTASAQPAAPLDARVSIRLSSGTLKDYLGQISAQSSLQFKLEGRELPECPVTAFLKDVTAREALQLSLEFAALRYRQVGRSGVFAFEAMPGKPFCPGLPPKKPASGSCRPGEEPLSAACEDGPLYSFLEILADQSQAGFLAKGGAGSYPVTARFSGADLATAVQAAFKAGLTSQQIGRSRIYVFYPRKPKTSPKP